MEPEEEVWYYLFFHHFIQSISTRWPLAIKIIWPHKQLSKHKILNDGKILIIIKYPVIFIQVEINRFVFEGELCFLNGK